ncbi:TetR/AcrR family transcriptional regulator [Nocardioides jejuensis]|uniref:TetR/AcrR family transcriptional regulator n=1 Tax=Nocardioides jejuensis TaxID=2502782 RepID=UPI001FB25EC1|nr:TetR/AcrR family transcriptional regulator [Nocardioides jejuensis]
MSRDTASQTPRRKYAARVPVDERREQLLDAALHVLVRDGYENVTIEAISQEAGVTRPVVYGAYDGLEPLLHALLDRTQGRALGQAMQLLNRSGDATDIDAWLIGATSGIIDVVQDDPDTWAAVLYLNAGAPAIVRERVAETRELIRQYVCSGLEAGMALRGGPDLDPQILSHLVLVTAEEFGRLILEEPPRYDKERLVQAMTNILRVLPKD